MARSKTAKKKRVVEIEQTIIRTVYDLSRSHTRVWPWMVGAQLDFYRCEQTLRRDMSRLAKEGRLMRIGQRKGYGPPVGMVC